MLSTVRALQSELTEKASELDAVKAVLNDVSNTLIQEQATKAQLTSRNDELSRTLQSARAHEHEKEEAFLSKIQHLEVNESKAQESLTRKLEEVNELEV